MEEVAYFPVQLGSTGIDVDDRTTDTDVPARVGTCHFQPPGSRNEELPVSFSLGTECSWYRCTPLAHKAEVCRPCPDWRSQ